MPTHPRDSAAAAKSVEEHASSGVEELLARRIILVTGKGGVGRTTVAAALARIGAEQGRRVLLAEFEEPSSLRTSPLAAHFGEEIFHDVPRRVADNIWGLTLHAVKGTELFLTAVFRVGALARLALRTAALRRLLHSGPSFHEMGVLYHLLHALKTVRDDKTWQWDLVIIDMPATGHTLALTELPRVLLKLVSRGPIAKAMREGQSFMNDPSKAVACVVTLPEPLPVSECLELMEGLAKTDVHVGAVLANRVPHNPFTDEEHAALESFLNGQPVRGQTLLDRLRRSEESLRRLQRGIDVPLIVAGEVDGDSILEGVMDALRDDLNSTRRAPEAPAGRQPVDSAPEPDSEGVTARVTALPIRSAGEQAGTKPSSGESR